MRRFQPTDIAEMIDVLKRDGIISVPTDTVYGVCGRTGSRKAEENLRNVKHRPPTKAFPIMCADLRQIKEIAQVDERAEKLIRAFMPGPVTLILKRNTDVSLACEDMETVAVRMATSKTLAKVIAGLGSPIFMTSANQSGAPTCMSLDEIEKTCPDLDGMLEGNISFGQASTIIDCSEDKISILREGPITMADIQRILK